VSLERRGDVDHELVSRAGAVGARSHAATLPTQAHPRLPPAPWHGLRDTQKPDRPRPMGPTPMWWASMARPPNVSRSSDRHMSMTPRTRRSSGRSCVVRT
jgi:hypothetical protein